MQLNRSALNGAGLNAAARGIISAFCALSVTASVSVDADVTRFVHADVPATAGITSWASHENFAYGDITANGQVSFLQQPELHPAEQGESAANANAVVTATGDQDHVAVAAPVSCVSQLFIDDEWIKHAAASITNASAQGSVVALRTVYAESAAHNDVDLVGAAWQIFDAKAPVSCSARLDTAPLITRFVEADSSCTSDCNVVPTRVVFPSGLFGGSAGLEADGGFTQAVSANLAGAAFVSPYAGFAEMSATVVATRSSLYAYATHTAYSGAQTNGTSSLESDYDYIGYGVSNLQGSATVWARAVEQQGVSSPTATSYVTPTANYIRRPTATANCLAQVEADTFAYRDAIADIPLAATLRVEPQVNNRIDGFSYQFAEADVTLIANGIAVAPFAIHFYGDTEVTADGSYVHMASTEATQSSATASVYADKTQPADAALSVSAGIHSVGTYVWVAAATVYIDSDVVFFPRTTKAARARARSTAYLEVTALSNRRGKVLVESTAGVVADAVRVAIATADVNSGATINAVGRRAGSVSVDDPPERTMYRKGVDRTMYRPASNRVMRRQPS